ncbi:MAG: pyridoxal-phosphate dependent enzyme, partial [Candidatus Methylomirabilales bacterium]
MKDRIALAIIEAAERKAFRPDQFLNPVNVAAHQHGTGREIWEQTGGKVDAFCALVGTGGTFVGVARALKARNPAVRCYAVEPASAPVLAGKRVKNPRHKLQGGGYAAVPPLWDPGLLRWVPHGDGRRGHPGGPAARAGGGDLRRLLLRRQCGRRPHLSPAGQAGRHHRDRSRRH